MSGIGNVGRPSVGPVPEPDTAPAAPAAPGTAPASSGTAPTIARPALPRPADLWATIARGPSRGPVGPGVNLDASGARHPVAFGTNGRFTATPGKNAETPKEIGDGLYAAASLIDDSKQNLFDATGATPATSAQMLATLRTDLATVKAGAPAPAGLTDLQALQLRSSGTTVLLELMTARGTPDATKREAFALYTGMIKAETNPTLRNGMATHLDRLRDTLPADLRPQIDGARDVFAPSKPPYDAWFKNGNSTLNVDWSAGTESFADDVTNLKKAGFKVVSQDYSKTVLEKTTTVNGQKTTFHVNMRPFHGDMYDNVGDPSSQMVIYTGHSNWGRNMRDSLSHVSDAAAKTGGKDKLVLSDLCVGKGEIQMFKDKFPDAHMITTHNSSYFIEGGSGEEPESEGFHAIMDTFNGIAARKGYQSISQDVRRDNPWQSDHVSEGIDNNFIFPTDVAVRRKVLDEDHDGQADVFDRLVDFNTFNVAEDTRHEFQAVDSGRPANELVGTKVHFAAQTINRLCLYSEIFEHRNGTGKVVPGGYFEPAAGEKDLFKFDKTTVDGKESIVMRMSSKYAHMSEEALRMAACYEYNRFVAQSDGRRWKPDAAGTALSGMILAQHSLSTDAGYRDDQVWGEFCKAYNLPAIDIGDVEASKEIEHDFYSGSYKSLDDLKKKLDPAQLAALTAPGAGRIEGNG